MLGAKKKTGIHPGLKIIFSEIPYSSYENESIDDVVSGAHAPVSKIILKKMTSIHTRSIIHTGKVVR
jgi:hypothetical protein